MKRLIVVPVVLFMCFVLTDAGVTFADGNVLWYDEPAAEWVEAMPVGNGALGAMVFGGVAEERLQLNEETVWTQGGSYTDMDGRKVLPKARKLLFSGDYEEAEALLEEKLMNERLPSGTNTYQALGDLSLAFPGHENYSGYHRELDLDEAVVRITYVVDGVTYTREVFSSFPDQALVMRISADKPGMVSFAAFLSRPGNAADIDGADGMLHMTEHVGGGKGVRMECLAKVRATGGETKTADTRIIVSDADEAVIFITAATDYRGDDPAELSGARMRNASAKRFDDLRGAHVDDYRALFGRVALDLGKTEASRFPTNERIKAVARGSRDPSLAALYFQFGRYLLISSSRPGCLPANLQGIWCDSLTPPWNSDYHININIQMNYWPAEVTNLSECHEPFLSFIGRLREKGRITAKTSYDCRGFTAHHTTDAWHNTALFGKPVYGLWPMGPAWCCRHYWEHYLYTGDKAFLAEVYPVMSEAALFCADFLVKHPGTGDLVSGPSISPENTFITRRGNRAVVNMGPAMDREIIHDLFTNCIAASRILDTDVKFRKKLEGLLDRLAPVDIGVDGRIMEWVEPFEEAEPGHRHMSHLYALHPSAQWTWQETPEFMRAALNSIEYRLAHGGGHTGWSRAWIINFFARLRDGDRAEDNITALIAKSTHPNMFDNHPPFQIDGNFGGCAGIAEMLLQSHAGEVELLPALPSAWPEGSVTGLCARGGFEVSMTWADGRLEKARILSKLGGRLRVSNGYRFEEIDTEPGGEYVFCGDLKLKQ